MSNRAALQQTMEGSQVAGLRQLQITAYIKWWQMITNLKTQKNFPLKVISCEKTFRKAANLIN